MSGKQFNSFELSVFKIEPTRDGQQVSHNSFETPIRKAGTSQSSVAKISQEVVGQISQQDKCLLSNEALFATG